MDDDSSRRKPSSRRETLTRRRSWCCSFAVPPGSPDSLSLGHHHQHHHVKPIRRGKSETLAKPIASHSVPSSPQSVKSSALGLVGRIDPRRILSPGRVSPIDSDPIREREIQIGAEPEASSAAESAGIAAVEPPPRRSRSFRGGPASSRGFGGNASGSGNGNVKFDVRLNLRGKKGGMLVLEMNSEVLCANSEVFGGLFEEFKKKSRSMNSDSSPSSGSSKACRIEVPEVENLAMFRETIELMFEDDTAISKRLLKIGVFRAIDVLEVSAVIMFAKGVSSCLKYLEAVPWTEEEEEKLRDLFTRFKFDDATTRDILARLYLLDGSDSQQNLARQLVWSLTSSTDANARHELKSLVKGLLCKSSVYEKDHPDLNKEDIYAILQSCLDSLVILFEETTEQPGSSGKSLKRDSEKPLIERVSRQVDNINWLLEILLDWQMAEEFVDMWANQEELLRMHKSASPMVRYELSRVSAILFIAMGTRKLHCHTESRSALLQSWFGPMLMDFGWLQRCRKGLGMKTLEEALGQALLTLPLKQQYVLFMEWFRNFSKHGTECPNLGKAFQIWWRRSFLRGSETVAIETR